MSGYTKLDLYSRAVLTVIAGCLLWLCLRPGLDVATARADAAAAGGRIEVPVRVDANLRWIGGLEIPPDAAVPVRIEGGLRPGE